MTQPRPVFAPAAFTSLDGGHGAEKLSQSAVAPLVAAARPYRTVRPEDVKDVAARLLRVEAQSTPRRQLGRAVAGGDVMLMPWHSLDTVGPCASREEFPRTPSSWQMRPSAPVLSADGDLRKYLNLYGSESVMDVHPATPIEWVTSAPTVAFVEGLIKGDAVVSGVLRAAGVTDQDLTEATHLAGADLARARLRELMRSVPQDQQVLVVSFIGVYNWRHRDEWNSLHLSGREGVVAFDADAAKNRQVWNQAQELLTYLRKDSRRMRSVRMLDLSRAGATAAASKVGIDDYLAGIGRWEDIPAFLGDLPDLEADLGADVPHGAWAVSEDGCSVREAIHQTDSRGNPLPVEWVERVPIGGRIAAREVRRQPDPRESETGRIDHGIESASDEIVKVEVSWRDPVTGSKVTGSISGPSLILGLSPKDWARPSARVEFPPGLLDLPAWPPAEPEKWLRAVKAHRLEEKTERVRMETMGWVPTEDGSAKFIAGRQVVTADGIADGTAEAGVLDSLAGAASFGVLPPADPARWREQALSDLEEVLDAYIRSGAIADPLIAATVLALGLRPAVPVRPQVTCYLVGSKAAGKSFLSSFMMSFWQPRPGTWNEKSLPGSASDTVASMEHAVARAMIWVADDLAPSVSKARAEQNEAAMSELIRSVFNGTGKRRMNPDMTSREVNVPRALLVVTAENELSVPSAADRVVVLPVARGTLAPSSADTAPLVEMRDETGVAARLCGGLLRWICTWAATFPGGFEALTHMLRDDTTAACRAAATAAMTNAAGSGIAARHAGMAADLMLVFPLLRRMAQDLGAGPQTLELLEETLPARVAEQVRRSFVDQQLVTPGRAVLRAVSHALSGGYGHVVSLSAVSRPPVQDREDADVINSALGWQAKGEVLAGQGRKVGWLVSTRADKRQLVVILDPLVAFKIAQDAFPGLLVSGMKPAQTWASVWSEGLAVPETLGWRRKQTGSGAKSPVVRVSSHGQSFEGVPVLLSHLLSADSPESEEADQAQEDDQAQQEAA